MDHKVLLITGATGHQGGAVIDALLANHTGAFTILAVTRTPSSPAAVRLAGLSPSIHLVQGDLNDVPALFAAARKASPGGAPIWGVYSVQISVGPSVTVEGEVRQGCDLVDESIQQGVKCFVYGSVERGGDEESWETGTPIPHFQSKHKIELHLREKAEGSKMAWTILRPVAFMENFQPGFQTAVFAAALRNHLGPSNKPLQLIACHDIGVFAAKAFAAHSAHDSSFNTQSSPTAEYTKYHNKAIGLAGDELTVDEMSESFKRATGRPMKEAWWPFGSALTYFVAEFGIMLRWFRDEGYKADVQARRRDVPGLLTLERWVREKSEWIKGQELK